MGYSRMSLLGEVSWVSYKYVIFFPSRIYEKLRLIYLWREGGLVVLSRTPSVQSTSFQAMVTVREVASQVEGMEERMVTLQLEFKQELDGLH